MRSEPETLLAAIKANTAGMQKENLEQDRSPTGSMPVFQELCSLGLLAATLPVESGGFGFGYNQDGARYLYRLLASLGEGSLPIARLYEGHVNALQLVHTFGPPALVAKVANDVRNGCLFALWVTDPPSGGLRLCGAKTGTYLEGSKAFCSAVGIANRALITAETATGTQMLIVDLDHGVDVKPSSIHLSGMRAAVTGSADFRGYQIGAECFLGREGDYLREPTFSAGAWRGSAAAFGALNALVDLHRQNIARRKRDGDPNQLRRFGQLLIAHETSRLWIENAATIACSYRPDASVEAVVAYVNLARIAIETACLDAMRLTQRSIGLSAFIANDLIELTCRDLATYLRQPAPDEVLEIGAKHYFKAGVENLQ